VFIWKKISIHLFVLVILLGSTGEAFQKHPKKPHQPHSRKKSVPQASSPATVANYGKYDFTLTTLDGKTIHLSDYAGKVVLVNIWGPWCGPCRLEAPGFARLYTKYKSKGFEIIGVAVKTNESDVRSFMQSYGISWPVGIKDDITRVYGTYGLPDSYLFKRDGSLAKQFIGYTKAEALSPFMVDALK
jgi:thiol-disulfide isomerase/thioredoxin